MVRKDPARPEETQVNEADKRSERWAKVVLAAIMVPFSAVVMAGAGALLTAMAIAAFSGGKGVLARALTVMLVGVFGKAPVVGLAAAVVVGGATFVFSRADMVYGAVAGGLFGFMGYALYTVFLTALEASVVGCCIGAAVGAVLGIAAGLAVSSDDRTPRQDRAAAARATSTRGEHPAEIEWWRADLDDGDE